MFQEMSSVFVPIITGWQITESFLAGLSFISCMVDYNCGIG